MYESAALVAPAVNILTRVYDLIRGSDAVTREQVEGAVRKAVRSEVGQHPAFRGAAAVETAFCEAILTSAILTFRTGGTTEMRASATPDGFSLRIDHRPLPSGGDVGEHSGSALPQLRSSPAPRADRSEMQLQAAKLAVDMLLARKPGSCR